MTPFKEEGMSQVFGNEKVLLKFFVRMKLVGIIT
jgi:hypothetical protein